MFYVAMLRSMFTGTACSGYRIRTIHYNYSYYSHCYWQRYVSQGQLYTFSMFSPVVTLLSRYISFLVFASLSMVLPFVDLPLLDSEPLKCLSTISCRRFGLFLATARLASFTLLLDFRVFTKWLFFVRENCLLLPEDLILLLSQTCFLSVLIWYIPQL